MSTIETTFSYGRAVVTKLAFDDAIERAKSLLKDEGFGVMCEIDIASTMREKLGAEMEPYRILGACNPTLAHAALAFRPQIGLLLPCNVVVQRDSNTTIVSVVDPRALLGVVDAGAELLKSIAAEVASKLFRVLDRIAAEGAS